MMKPVPGPTSAPLHPLQVLAHSEPVQRDGQPGRLGQRVAIQITDAVTRGDAPTTSQSPIAFTPDV